MELPFAPNFPMPAGDQRLYLAEFVAAVIEVKSNLSSQWSEVESTVAAVRTLRRDLREPKRFIEESPPDTEPQLKVSDIIPCYVAAYTGHTTTEGLQERLASILLPRVDVTCTSWGERRNVRHMHLRPLSCGFLVKPSIMLQTVQGRTHYYL